jgi:hypothetical protein
VALNINNTAKKSLKIPKGGNQNPYIEKEQTAQWQKEKAQKDKQRSTKHTHHFESLAVATMTWLTVMEYLCHK